MSKTSKILCYMLVFTIYIYSLQASANSLCNIFPSLFTSKKTEQIQIPPLVQKHVINNNSYNLKIGVEKIEDRLPQELTLNLNPIGPQSMAPSQSNTFKISEIVKRVEWRDGRSSDPTKHPTHQLTTTYTNGKRKKSIEEPADPDSDVTISHHLNGSKNEVRRKDFKEDQLKKEIKEPNILIHFFKDFITNLKKVTTDDYLIYQERDVNKDNISKRGAKIVFKDGEPLIEIAEWNKKGKQTQLIHYKTEFRTTRTNNNESKTFALKNKTIAGKKVIEVKFGQQKDGLDQGLFKVAQIDKSTQQIWRQFEAKYENGKRVTQETGEYDKQGRRKEY